MPDYNKGDFTQQGVDGFVEGGLHLNEKRCLTAKISTDEDSAGLDSVEINIHDHLNDLDYTFSGENVIAGTSVIGQAPSGNIEITENGENINVAPFATATVNVSGGGDSFPMCTATIVNTDADGANTSLNYDNGKLLFTPFERNATTVCHFLYQYYPAIEDTQDVGVSCDAWNLSADDISNLVNLSFTNGALLVTDPTQDSSLTIDAYAFTMQ